MSDEERDDKDEYDPPKEGESDHEWMQRQTSPELRWLDLFHRLTARVETNEEEAKHRAEETQRNIEFIVRQQAQFSTDIHRLRELQEQNENRWARTGEEIRALLAIAEIHEREFVELRQAQAEAQARTDAQMTETDERINALVNTVERVISERRNGGGKKSEGS